MQVNTKVPEATTQNSPNSSPTALLLFLPLSQDECSAERSPRCNYYVLEDAVTYHETLGCTILYDYVVLLNIIHLRFRALRLWDELEKSTRTTSHKAKAFD